MLIKETEIYTNLDSQFYTAIAYSLFNASAKVAHVFLNENQIIKKTAPACDCADMECIKTTKHCKV